MTFQDFGYTVTLENAAIAKDVVSPSQLSITSDYYWCQY